MRSIVYSKRVIKELLREPLSYIFCLGFPIFMLLLFTVINSSIPAEAQNTLFTLNSMAPGIGMFGLTFIMLFVSLQISKDRESCLLSRLYTSPMTAFDFICGYSLPTFVLSVLQIIIAFAFSAVLGLFTGESVSFAGSVRSTLSLLPCAVLFISTGLLFGSIFSDKSAPGISSVLITLSSIMGGVWIPLDTMKGLEKICDLLPYYHAVKAARRAMLGVGNVLVDEIIVVAYAVVIFIIAVLVFKKKMKQ